MNIKKGADANLKKSSDKNRQTVKTEPGNSFSKRIYA